MAESVTIDEPVSGCAKTRKPFGSRDFMRGAVRTLLYFTVTVRETEAPRAWSDVTRVMSEPFGA
jgi:hypothetical protein